MKHSQTSKLAVLAGLVTASCGSNTAPANSSFEGGTGDSGHHDATTVLKNPGDTGMLGGGDGGSGGGDACATTTATANQTPLDIYFLLNRSGSMAYNNSWVDEVQALETFFDDYRSNGIGVGLGYMPENDLCDWHAYLPAVPIATLPGTSGSQQAALETSLSNTLPYGACPTTVGLEGAVAAAKANQVANPTHTTVIVFPSDGTHINGCAVVPDGGLANSTENAIAVLTAAANATPPIRTFVIGITPEERMNEYAAAGGTGKAILLGVSDAGISDAALTDALDPLGFVPGAIDAAVVSIEAPLIAAFSSIRTQALPCEYSIPQATSGAIDFGDVNVRFTPGAAGSGSAAQQFYGVATLAACQSNTLDWYYDNPSAPQHIELCPNACSTVKAATVGQVNVDYGCQTISPPK